MLLFFFIIIRFFRGSREDVIKKESLVFSLRWGINRDSRSPQFEVLSDFVKFAFPADNDFFGGWIEPKKICDIEWFAGEVAKFYARRINNGEECSHVPKVKTRTCQKAIPHTSCHE